VLDPKKLLLAWLLHYIINKGRSSVNSQYFDDNGSRSVVTPVSNDKILSTNEGKTAESGKREAESMGTSGNAAAPSPQNNAAQATETVDVGRASQLFNQAAQSLSDEPVISNPEQAKEVAAEITQQFTSDADKALRSQAGSASGDLAVLLEAAPA
jgi:hypothetical protein